MKRALGLTLLLGALACAGAATTTTSTAQASVSIAVLFDPLVSASDAIAIVVPAESTSVWEDGRIYTYTRVKIDNGVAGELATGSEAWVRTRGGVVGKIGQMVDGEAVFVKDKPSLVFLRRGNAGTFDVNARSQGQFPVLVDEQTKTRRLVRAANVGVLYPPKEILAAQATGAQPRTAAPATRQTPVLAADMIHGRPVDDALKDIAAAYKRLRATKP
jgi:hypothetical protein